MINNELFKIGAFMASVLDRDQLIKILEEMITKYKKEKTDDTFHNICATCILILQHDAMQKEGNSKIEMLFNFLKKVDDADQAMDFFEKLKR